MGKHTVFKLFCVHGHEIAIVGRDKGGNCNQCLLDRSARLAHPRQPKLFCNHGHELAIVGRYSWGMCKGCKKVQNEREYIHKPKVPKQICVNGHDTFICGRSTQGYCRDCKTEEHKKKLAADINYKLICDLRTRLWQAIKSNQKVGSAIRDLGCSIDFLKKYIESQFHDGMTWDNWGEVWELDHIEELADFDLTDREQFLKVCHYTNLQPLTMEEHRKKTNAGISKRALLKELSSPL